MNIYDWEFFESDSAISRDIVNMKQSQSKATMKMKWPDGIPLLWKHVFPISLSCFANAPGPLHLSLSS